MATTCKLIFGYIDQFGNWYMTNEFYRHYDGYDEAIIPHLKKHIDNIRNRENIKPKSHKFDGDDIKTLINDMNKSVESNSHKFEHGFDFGATNYMYYIDIGNRAQIKCTILEEDNDFFKKYWINNYKVKQELIL